MQALALGDRVIHWRSDGPEDGPALVFSNSLGTDLRVWSPMTPHLPRGARLLRYDAAGHGLSDHRGARGIEEHANDLVAVMDAAGVERAVVVGLSVGGLIAQALAAARPDRVAGLVLSNTAAKIGDAALWDERIAAIERDGLAPMAETILARWFSARFHEERPAELALWRAMLTRTPVEGYLALCKAIRDADYRSRAPAITAPTLALGGSEDGSTPPDVVKATADLIQGARFELIEGAGHLPCVEAPKITAALIGGFLTEIGYV
ncbi:MAG: 3-oxoadipate enol-lactonase [Marivibrio sp.]|uniref:3-oxoadipate enol-lactonase n=1 Tax=Marivibrio sp. TaxID=2039719 RepID=UPI0032EDC8F4